MKRVILGDEEGNHQKDEGDQGKWYTASEYVTFTTKHLSRLNARDNINKDRSFALLLKFKVLEGTCDWIIPKAKQNKKGLIFLRIDQMGSHIQVSNSDGWDGKGKNNKSSSSWISEF